MNQVTKSFEDLKNLMNSKSESKAKVNFQISFLKINLSNNSNGLGFN